MQSHTGFSLQELFRELELRFGQSIPLSSPELLGYYLTFLLLDHPLDETWLILLDSQKRLLRNVQITESTLSKEKFVPLLHSDTRIEYYCFVHTHGNYPIEPSRADIFTNQQLSTNFGTNPTYLGAYIVNQDLNFELLTPQKFKDMQQERDPPRHVIEHEKMQKNTGFGLWDLCKDLERRFFTNRPMTAPEHMAYYATFFLHDDNPEHTWFFFLNTRKRLQRTLQVLQKVAGQNACANHIAENFGNTAYFYIARRMETVTLEPTSIDRQMHVNHSQRFQKKPKYLGLILVSASLDYLYLPPDTDYGQCLLYL